MNGSPSKHNALDWFTSLARWALGILFIYMGLVKASDPVNFLKLVHQYDLVHTPFLLNFIAVTLPWFEVFCGLLLATGIAVRGSALMLLVMLIPFTTVVLLRALAIHTAQSIPLCAVKFDCGCGSGEVWICHKLVENSLLILLAILILAGYGKKLSARYALFG